MAPPARCAMIGLGPGVGATPADGRRARRTWHRKGDGGGNSYSPTAGAVKSAGAPPSRIAFKNALLFISPFSRAPSFDCRDLSPDRADGGVLTVQRVYFSADHSIRLN